MFDKETVQNELDLQRTVSRQFGQTSRQIGTEISRQAKEHRDTAEQLDQAAAKADEEGHTELARTLAAQANDERQKAAGWQRGGVLLNMISAGLSAPTQSATGIAAATASPVISYEIGQYFKGKNAEGSAAHILAHAVLGAAVAAAGDNNALAGAISAGGAEAAAPRVSQFLYGTDKANELTAEQKETITAITNLLGTGIGAIVGNTTANTAQGNLNAGNAVENNAVNKNQAGTIDGFISIFDNTPSKMGQLKGEQAHEAMLRLDNTDWDYTPNTTPYFNLRENRYIYTNNGGWIDMVHFLFYASKAYSEKIRLQNENAWKLPSNYGQIQKYSLEEIQNRSINNAIQFGYIQERLDSLKSPHSAYSYEDLPSDKYGTIFGARYFNPSSDKTFGEQVSNYFSNVLKSTIPQRAPNFSSLPEKDNGEHSGIFNKTTNPMFIDRK